MGWGGGGGQDTPTLKLINQPATEDTAAQPGSPLVLRPFPQHDYWQTSWAFLTLLTPTQKLHFRGTFSFLFLLLRDREHKQIYTTGVFCCRSCLNVVKSVSQK